MNHYPYGSYRRRIRIVNTDSGVVTAGLEDDFHYFIVQITHNEEVVTGITAQSIRWPWNTCPGAAAPLQQLVGMELSPRCLAVGAVTSPAHQCTHMFDLAGLAVAHAARATDLGDQRQYDLVIPYGVGRKRTVTCARDGELILSWELAGRECIAPSPYSDAPWQGGFLKWADSNLDVDDAEAAIVLRRACDIGMGRGMDLDAVEQAVELADLMTGVCFTMQPEQIAVARRNRGTIRNFDDNPEMLLADGP